MPAGTKAVQAGRQKNAKEIRSGVSEERRNLENNKRLSSESRYVCLGENLRQNNLVAGFQRHNGFLPIRRFAGLGGPLTARLAAHVQCIDLGDLHLE
jgi:hypothetical protein